MFLGYYARMNCPLNIYIHVPYCLAKCNYCAFFSTACPHPDWPQYAHGICTEIENWAQKIGRITVPTVFFGGGTPSLMPVSVFATIMNKLRDCWDIANDAEISLEANPATIDGEKLDGFIENGLNRLSIGVQSFDDEKLRFLGRRHNVSDALKLIECAHTRPVRVSADFIYGLPNDTVKAVADMCHQINDLGLTHCSIYELTIEPNTPFGKMNLDMPSNDSMADMYIAIGETLKLPRYEVSNYATAGNECRHNLNIWDGAPYIGIGRGASGRVLIDNVWYEQMGNDEIFTPLAPEARAIERIIMGLRMVRGIKLDPEIKKVINIDYVNNHPEYIKVRDNRIRATEHGMIILDDIILNLVK